MFQGDGFLVMLAVMAGAVWALAVRCWRETRR